MNRFFIIALLLVIVTTSQVHADTYGSVDESVIRRIVSELDPLSFEERNELLARLDDKDFLALQYILGFSQLNEANNDRYYDLYEEMYSNARGSMTEADHQQVLRLIAEWSYRELQYLEPGNAYYDLARLLLEEVGNEDPTMASIHERVNDHRMDTIGMRSLAGIIEEYCSSSATELSSEGLLYLRLLKQGFPAVSEATEE